ncbi:MAG: hypothetical protein PHP42_03795 [Bacteroidota bacterium]|nr:hypothetical protein [Bacteroidota bacterium]
MKILITSLVKNIRIGCFIFLLSFISVNTLWAQKSPHGPLKQPCTDCHTTASWKTLASPMKFNHSTTGFVLNGAHVNVLCLQCHTAKKFAGTSTDCFSCHEHDFKIALTPNHNLGKFSRDCLTCHTYKGWRPSIFQHSKTNFQLVGAHLSVQCSSCHTNNRYAGMSNDCYSCHVKDFNGTTAPSHTQSQFPHDCKTCHTMNAWQPATFDHNKTNFTLVGVHSTLECASCHKNGQFKGTPVDCYSCHQKDYAGTTVPNHAVAQMSHDCSTCHATIKWQPSTFNHNMTNFKLVDGHSTVDCASCHKNGVFKGTPTDCYSCHQPDFAKSVTTNHVTGQFSHDCLTCHGDIVWKPATFDHNKTNFKLSGAHKTADCSSCHKNGQFKGLPLDCYACHQQDFAKTVTPNHLVGQFSHDCLTCHSDMVWKPSLFDHNKTNFSLVGSHITVDCASCHKNGVFKGTPMDCYSCHQNNFNATTNPNHALAQFSHDCIACHNTMAWKPSMFDHNKTNFRLVGSHIAVDCASCHKNGVFKGTPMDCYSCHQNNFNATTNPNHTLAQFSHDCISCHNTIAWKPSMFDHNKTNFRLVGSHLAVNCASCHKNGVFKGTPMDCYSCHRNNFVQTTLPNHSVAQFSHDCISCHNTMAWKPSTFDHNKTNFRLVGAHVSLDCALCHKIGSPKATPTDCYGCHQTNFNSTTNPNHALAQFSHDCITCHNTIAWQPSTFDHNTTNFKLVGAHATLDCSSCHKNGVFKGTPMDCYSCHQSNFAATTAPNHTVNQFSHDCTTCHNTIAWRPSTFNHSQTTFPLMGVHATTDCLFCHKNGQYAGLPTDCYSCHQTDFAGTTNPNHVSGNFDHNCATCHSTNGWSPASFDHSKTVFPLTGNHMVPPRACVDCHASGKFAGTPTDCYSCHASNYNATTNPSHTAAGFPTTCATCHTSTTTWLGATFNHTQFPIGSADKHKPGVWNICADCHTNSSNYAVFTCITCHAHDKSLMDPKHSQVSGYSYDSNACYRCHPNGRAG